MSSFTGRDILSLKGLERHELELIFDIASDLEPIARNRTRTDLLDDKILATLFFQVSTRTRLSFESAMIRLGGGVLGFADPKTTRAGDYWQESLLDTVRMIENYADILVIRHPKDGAPAEAAEVCRVPIFNAGDGYNEHPTQALTDLYTIRREKGNIDGLTLAIVADMRMRALHSLPLGLGRYNTKVYFVSPPEKTLPTKWKEELNRIGLDYEEKDNIEEIIEKVDVIYMHTVVNPDYSIGRADVVQEKNPTPQGCILNRDKLRKAKSGVIVLHPFQRADEMPIEIDQTYSARYFQQAFYGVAIRMALLALVLGRVP